MAKDPRSAKTTRTVIALRQSAEPAQEPLSLERLTHLATDLAAIERRPQDEQQGVRVLSLTSLKNTQESEIKLANEQAGGNVVDLASARKNLSSTTEGD